MELNMDHSDKLDLIKIVQTMRELVANTEKDQQFRNIILYRTNADLECIEKLWEGIQYDLAETLMHKAFYNSEFDIDYMLIDSYSQEILAYLFSNRSKELRNECQG